MPTHVINAEIIKLNIKNRKKREQIFIAIPSCLQNKRYLRCDFPLLFFSNHPLKQCMWGGTYIEKITNIIITSTICVFLSLSYHLPFKAAILM